MYIQEYHNYKLRNGEIIKIVEEQFIDSRFSYIGKRSNVTKYIHYKPNGEQLASNKDDSLDIIEDLGKDVAAKGSLWTKDCLDCYFVRVVAYSEKGDCYMVDVFTKHNNDFQRTTLVPWKELKTPYNYKTLEPLEK